ncbi:hypothetical protein ACIBCM_20355 [Streptomyces sp. NPDC051018]|uniref:hypothetical protein n=1 Tax=Streptomyces sp. NPDC051018 TaxID=3365639 RepID=UPI0037B9C2A6
MNQHLRHPQGRRSGDTRRRPSAAPAPSLESGAPAAGAAPAAPAAPNAPRAGRRRGLRALPALALPALLFVALTGCGASGGTDETADAKSPSPKAAADGVAYAKCLREHGIDAADPGPDGGSNIKVPDGGEAKLKAAEAACKKYAPEDRDAPLDPNAHDKDLKLARCLRANGLDVKDPQPGKPLELGSKAGEEAKVEKAQRACQKEAGPPKDEKGTS